MPKYCLLMNADTSNVSGNVGSAEWVSPDDTKFQRGPGRNTQKFYKSDNVSVGLCITQNGAAILPSDLVIAAIVTPKKSQANATPYRFGGGATNNRQTMLLGSITGQGGISVLTAFDSNGNIGSWDGVTYKWIGFDYLECLVFHDSDDDSNFELTVSARMSGSQSWAYDPEMDVGKSRNK
jgi:hypothetical protein